MSSSQDTEVIADPSRRTTRKNLKQLIAEKRRQIAVETVIPDSTTGMVGDFADPYENANSAITLKRQRTAIVYDHVTAQHKCEWDPYYPEGPQRLAAIMRRLYELSLIDRCQGIDNSLRMDVHDRICKVHSQSLPTKLKIISSMKKLREVEFEATKFDAIYFNERTFEVATRAVSTVMNLVEAVVTDKKLQNGFALVRPPGHHATVDQFCGYCFFNNVAVAAQMCLDKKIANKILIIDFDVHHGQGTQQHFYDSKDVFYFSIHRYEHGTFWPNLAESNFNYIGEGAGIGYNMNVPLNSTGLNDVDYLAIVFNLLLPVVYEFNPDLIIISAGYDACVGCPEGQMNITPGFYAHLITLLTGLAKGKIVVVLEGGYFLPSLAEGVAMTLKALLGDPCPVLDPLILVHPSTIQTICDVRRAHMDHWACFRICEIEKPTEGLIDANRHTYEIIYQSSPLKPPYLTRNCYPILTPAENGYHTRLVQALQEKYNAPFGLPVCLTTNEEMTKHEPADGSESFECPERLTAVMDAFNSFGIVERCQMLHISERPEENLFHPHDPDYIASIGPLISQKSDLYTNDFTRLAMTLAVSSVLEAIDNVMADQASAGLAVVRPPGHHAEIKEAMGFCVTNNVAIGAQHLMKTYNVHRILIFDFDVHHGNGTQRFFYDSKNVMYISIHRYENGNFYPKYSPANYTDDGYGSGKGYNINIPFSKGKMGDTEYLLAFHNIVLPIAYSFAPQVIIVSAGFDAGINDPLGKYKVSPETFGHMILMLKPLASGKLIVVLEGGYNLPTTSLGMTMCAKALLGDPLPIPSELYKICSENALETLRQVIDHFKQFWPILNVNKKLSDFAILLKKPLNSDFDPYEKENHKILPPERVTDADFIEEQMETLNEN